MAKVALNGATNASVTAPSHITYRVWEYWYTDGMDVFYRWVYYNTNSIVTGNSNASPSNVYINGVNAVLSGDQTTENDSYSIPSGEYVEGAHYGARGSVISGNSNNVYINGKLVAVEGSQIRTHSSYNTTIQSGGSSNVFIG